MLRSTDPWHEFRHREPARRFHPSPFPMHPRGCNRMEPGTWTREAADKQATASLLVGLTIVALDPYLHRLADMPGGMVPDAPESPCAPGRHVCGTPGQKGAGDHADGTPVDNASQPGVGGRHLEPITGPGLACWVFGRHALFHQAARLAGAPSMPLGLGLTTPPDVIFKAQGEVWMFGG